MPTTLPDAASGHNRRRMPSSAGSMWKVKLVSAVTSIGASTPYSLRRSAAAWVRITMRSVMEPSLRTLLRFEVDRFPESTAYAMEGLPCLEACLVAHRKAHSSAEVQVSM
jgi:glycyl-tRNA synthetase beta subunit